MNCNLTQCFTACVYVLKCLVDPDIPINEGFYAERRGVLVHDATPLVAERVAATVE